MAPTTDPVPRRAAPSRESPDRAEVILLAAGRSRRMGGTDKLLLPAASESAGPVPLVRRSLDLYRSLGLPVTVVLPDREGPVARALGVISSQMESSGDSEITANKGNFRLVPVQSEPERV